MGKIIGLISVCGDEDWIDMAIQQALKWCDDVVVGVGPHTDNMKPFDDATLERCQHYIDRIRLFRNVNVGRRDHGMAITINNMMRTSPIYELGTWVWILDSDEFYLDEEAQQLADMIHDDHSELNQNGHDWIRTPEKFFFINTRHYLDSERDRLCKITNLTHNFIPTHRWPNPKDNIYHFEGEGMFHYCILKNPYKKMAMWKSEHNVNPREDHPLVKWYNEIYVNFDLNDPEPWVLHNEELFGIKTSLGKGDLRGDENGHPFIYDGPHPKCIEDAGLTKIDDFRKLWEK